MPAPMTGVVITTPTVSPAMNTSVGLLGQVASCCSRCRRPKVAIEQETDSVVPFAVVEHSLRNDVVVTYPNHTTYRGQFKDGKRHGRGVLTDAQGTKHDAEWRNDKRQGKGNETYLDGTKFVGTYVEDLRSGHGTMTWPEGSKYDGQFSRGKANGEGVLQRTDGSIYRGHFSEDSMSGHGCMQWRDGVKYVGQFVANRREGAGRMTWNSGKWHTFEGTWRNGMQHGQGTLVDHSGQVFHGVFQWGKLVRWCDRPGGEDEEDLDRPMEAPMYWINQDLAVQFNQRTEVSDVFRAKIQEVLDGTFKAVRTRDRAGGVPTSLRLVKCHRVENSAVWMRYQRAKDRLRHRRPDKVKSVTELAEGGLAPVKTEEFLGSDITKDLEQDINEYYLWHGTTPAGAIGISTDGFKLKLAGSHAGTYFGNGCYFAESSSKSDEYAREGSDLLAGVYALLLCRVACGSLFRTTHPDESAIQSALRSGNFDAVLGDREASVGTYREFVVYEEDLAYPEYVVLYERRHDASLDG